MKRFIKWLVSHLFVRAVDLQAKPDDMSQDEVKPKTAAEIGIKIRW